MHTIKLTGADLISRNVAFVHDQPARDGISYIVTNPYSLSCIRGKWHINNIFPSVSEKRRLHLSCMI